MLRIHQQPFIQEVIDRRLKSIRLFIKREDVIHPYVSGNKWRKLKYNLLKAQNEGYDTLLTFGGAYSNHIYATAAAANEVGLKSIGIIRGEELENKPLNSTLAFAQEQGMKLYFVDRSTYRSKTDESFLNRLSEELGRFFLIPEGGTNMHAVKGASEIVDKEVRSFDYVCCSVGTGGTVAGIIQGMEGQGRVLGFSALKGDFLINAVQQLIGEKSTLTNWEIINDYHFGGYAKTEARLLNFIRDFESDHKVPIEPIYTGKLLFGIYDMVSSGFFESQTKILVIHTGGLRH